MEFTNGWIPDQTAYDNLASECPYKLSDLMASDSESDSEVLLFESELKVDGKYRKTHYQKANSCTSHGIGGGIDQAAYVEIANGADFMFEEAATEVIYGGAVVNVGRSRGDNGAVVSYGLKFCQQGYAIRGEYKADGRTFNLRDYTKENDLYFCNKGVSAEMLKFCDRKIGTLIPIESVEDAVKCLKKKIPIVAGSNQGFSSATDAKGFCSPRGNWAHCTFWNGVIDGPRPGINYQQSWNGIQPTNTPTVTLPSGREITLPQGNFFVDLDIIERMIRQGEAFGIVLESGMRRLVYGRTA